MSATATVALAFGLAMDSFAAALGKGAGLARPCLRKALTVGAVFGLFQAVMPLLGFALGAAFAGLIEAVDHWIAFVLLGVIGGRMVLEAARGPLPEEQEGRSELALAALFAAGVATSIDAMAAGISLGLFDTPVVCSALVIGLVTFALSVIGVYLGRLVGPLFGRWAVGAGGVGLVLLGIKILVQHTLGL
ncbi:manganese efflux pump MntP family protein [Oleisolibacter albus]|uniref:manganese efflux pump MntP n=1 Tax=Oleisolibacter albus TaxID=2171757 RepID=UPI000DF22AFA|nr:manganese efflux pump MntP family protein [Oleisolibacter albus]